MLEVNVPSVGREKLYFSIQENLYVSSQVLDYCLNNCNGHKFSVIYFW